MGRRCSREVLECDGTHENKMGLWSSAQNTMNITHRLPKQADFPDFEFRFISSPTPEMYEQIAEMKSRALDYVEEAMGCDCPPWIVCDHGDRAESERWSVRFRKLASANEAALMAVWLTPAWMNPWLSVDALVLGADGVCRP